MQWNEFRSHIGHLSTREQERVRDAFELGKRMHAGQKRKSGEPYFSHPIAVADVLADMGADSETIIAALLHDTVEDTPLTQKEIETLFGSAVGTLIDGVTKLSAADVAEKPKLNEQIETLRKMFRLMEKDVRIMVIKLIDRLHNIQTAEFLPAERRRLLAQETIDVYTKIADRLCMQDIRDDLEGLSLEILEPELYGKLSSLRTQVEVRGEEVLSAMHERIAGSQPQAIRGIRMLAESKAWSKSREQLRTEGTVVTGVSAVTVVFVCEDVDSCYRTLGLLHQLWKREAMSFQDFINSPAINGYRGLHTTVLLEDGTRVRCKIRTAEMHDYARKGIVTQCFKRKRSGLPELLSWAERISPLTEDTEGHSNEFWQTLQSDILGESIVIHGPADQSVTVPKGSTALDGAFYLFRDEALKLTSISIGGKTVSLSTPLEHAASLNLTIGDELAVDRTWLGSAKTGFAIASIRSALAAGKSEAEKISLGKELLQRVLTQRRRGFLEEFDERKLSEQAKRAGYSSMRQAYSAVADGRLEPEHLYKALFEKESQSAGPPQHCVVRYTAKMENIEMMDRLNGVHRSYGQSLDEIRYARRSDEQAVVTLKARLSQEEQAVFRHMLAHAGAQDIDVTVRLKGEFGLLGGVILLWALNPVFAKWLLAEGMPAFGLITVRLLSFSAFTTLFFVCWRLISKVAYKPIPHLTRVAFLPTLGNAGMSFFTYFALLFLPPSLHLTILRFNTFLLPGISGKMRFDRMLLLATLFFLLIASSVFSLRILGETRTIGVLLSVATLLCYTLYSLSTERALQQNKIGVRYPYLLFHMGLLLGLVGLLMLPWQSLLAIPPRLLFATVAYSLLCVCIPHALYSALLKTARFQYFTDLLLLEVPIAMILEAAILHIVLPPVVYAAVGVILITLFVLRWEKFSVVLND